MPTVDVTRELTVNWDDCDLSVIGVSHPPGVDPLRETRAAIKRIEERLRVLRLVEQRLEWVDFKPPVALGCRDCGLAYGGVGWMDVVIPDDVWTAIEGEGVICINCLARRCEVKGLKDVPFVTKSGPMRLSEDDEVFHARLNRLREENALLHKALNPVKWEDLREELLALAKRQPARPGGDE